MEHTVFQVYITFYILFTQANYFIHTMATHHQWHKRMCKINTRYTEHNMNDTIQNKHKNYSITQNKQEFPLQSLIGFLAFTRLPKND